MLSPKADVSNLRTIGPVAQLGRIFASMAYPWREHLAFNQVARGSNPLRPAFYRLFEECALIGGKDVGEGFSFDERRLG